MKKRFAIAAAVLGLTTMVLAGSGIREAECGSAEKCKATRELCQSKVSSVCHWDCRPKCEGGPDWNACMESCLNSCLKPGYAKCEVEYQKCMASS